MYRTPFSSPAVNHGVFHIVGIALGLTAVLLVGFVVSAGILYLAWNYAVLPVAASQGVVLTPVSYGICFLAAFVLTVTKSLLRPSGK